MLAHDSLHLSLLGELVVSRGGERLTLPPSRKTRALLAYLTLTGRVHRRDRLCAMFWDVADDPRGALRWSLSKLRALLDEPGRCRIAADRESVRVDLGHCEVDALELRRRLGQADLEQQPIDELELWAGRFRGELLEGLDLSDFDDYQAWCVAEREQARKLRASILQSLSRRLACEPERALPHARAWVQVDPLNQEARIELLRMAFVAGRHAEAEQHYESGRRMLEELGARQVQPLLQTWRELKASRESAASSPVAAAPPAQAAPGAPAPRLIGRDAELQRLQALLSQVGAQGRPQVAVVSGEPGIGKTRLLYDLQAWARQRGSAVLWGAAYESETGRPYGPFIDALRGAPDVARESGERLSLLVPELGEAAAHNESRERLFGGVSDWFGVCAQVSPPLLLVLDDVQWLDRASGELLHYVVRTNPQSPILVALTARSEELPDNSTLARVLRALRRDRLVSELALSALDETEVADLVRELGGALSAQRIYQQSGGNPLFALELARGAGDDDRSLPSSAADAVRDRIERLPDAAMDVLRWGAVLGSAFTEARLQALMALDDGQVVAALELLSRHALICSESEGDGARGYLFSHEIVQRVVYADLSQPRRELMHRRVAQVLHKGLRDGGDALSGELAAEIARHATLGQDHDLAAAACASAGRRCLRVFANDDARTLARRGIRHAGKLPDVERIKRTIELREVQIMASRLEDHRALTGRVEALAEEALDLGLNDEARVAFHLLSFLEWSGGDWSIARKHTMASMVANQGTTGRSRVIGMAEAGRCLVLLEHDLPEAHALLLEASARARSLDMEPATLADGMGMISLHQGRLQQAAELFERARTLARTEGDHLHEYYALEHLAMVQIELQDYGAAQRTAQAMLPLAERLPEGSEVATAGMMRALARWAGGDADAARALDAELEALRILDAKHRLAYGLCHSAAIELDHGDARTARGRAAEALAIAQVLERPSETLLSRILLARACRELGDTAGEAEQRSAIGARGWSDASVPVRNRHEMWLGDRLPGRDATLSVATS